LTTESSRLDLLFSEMGGRKFPRAKTAHCDEEKPQRRKKPGLTGTNASLASSFLSNLLPPHRSTPEATAATVLGGVDSGPPRQAPRRSARWWWPRRKWRSIASTPSCLTTAASSRRPPLSRTATSKRPPSTIVHVVLSDAKRPSFMAISIWFRENWC
jgi:hypothetical protein